MKTQRRFWIVTLLSFALIVIGYLGFVGLTPNTSAGGVIPLFLLCVLMIITGSGVLVGAFFYAIVRLVIEHRSKKSIT